MRALIEVNLKSSKILHEWLNCTWILNMCLQGVVSIDLLWHESYQIREDLISLNCWDVVGMDSVWNQIIISMKSHINASWWLILHTGVSKELSLNLDVKIWVLICVQGVEFSRITTIELIMVGCALILILTDRNSNFLNDLGLNFESLIDENRCTSL